MAGTLYLCGTPIGNLNDLSPRAVEILSSADLIAAEDTRHSLNILNHFGIKTPMTSYHEHNRKSKGEYLISLLEEGKNIALVTDAGMPGISDPGEDLAALCIEKGIPVTTVPGPTAFVSALVLSGFSGRRFIFEGFLPSNKKEKNQVLESLKRELRTVIFYEAPHRLTQTLSELQKALGDRNAACVREITKIHEEVKRGTLGELYEFYSENAPRGEFVIVIEGFSAEALKEEETKKFEAMSLEEHMEMYTSQGMSEKEAMKLVAKDRGLTKRDIYSELKK
ncbi:MAG: 16S rRNA (cytidine(1402)-2'-O)-methyltransferase [Firmicutes bacterium]|nr:16S rRNA (cytidine(1402)-2'-O)-methyltransferase [Bacillota bacterium]MBQ7241240.1 16S rRNA (cytidine(1402)-2'-O)-methyltransferase [Bacillota bacterium]MBR0103999.1 16S rRNA (cytidine(1402)-2'-O)-methyltransferase [Bacillota bacterium]